jgi:hypothetical protein
MPFLGSIGAMDSISIVLARPEPWDVDVPDLIGLFFKADPVGLLGHFRAVEQTELNRRSML